MTTTRECARAIRTIPDNDGGLPTANGGVLPPDVPSVLQRSVDEAARLVGASGGVVCVLDSGTGRLKYAHEAGSSRKHIRFWARSVEVNDGTGLIARSMSERRVMVTGDYVTDRSFVHAPSADRVMTRLGYRSLLVAPLLLEGRAIGILSVFSGRWEAFTDEHIALVGALADHAAGAIANAQLIGELAESREQLAHRVDAQRSLTEIAARLTSIRQPDELLQYAVNEATRLLGADGGLIDRVDEQGRIRWGFGAGVHDEAVREILRGLELRVGEGLFGRAVAAGEIEVTGDYEADDRFEHAPGADEVVRRIGIRSLIAAPLIADGEALGVLGIYSDQADFFDSADVELLGLFADHASVAIANSRLIDELGSSQAELEHRAEAERSLRKISARISALHDQADVLQLTVDESARLVGGDGAILELLDPEDGLLRWAFDSGVSVAFDPRYVRELTLPVGVGLTGEAVAERRVRLAGRNLAQAFPASPESDEFFRQTGFQSMIAAPVVGEGGAMGAIEVYSTRTDAFSEADGELIGALATQAAIAITNARLIDELARSRLEIERRADAERSLREIAARLTALREPSAVLQRTVDEAARLLNADGAALDLIDSAAGTISWAYDAGLSDPDLEAVIRRMEQPAGEGLVGIAFAEGRVAATGDYLSDTSFSHLSDADRFIERAGVRSMAAAPLHGEHGALGILSIYSRQSDAFGPDEIAIVETFAHQAAIALTNAQLIEQLDRSRSQLAERVETEKTLREITERIAAIRDPDEILQRIVDEAQRLLRTDGAHLTLMSEDGTHLTPVVVAGTADQATRDWLQVQKFPLHGGMNGLAAGVGRSLWTADYVTDPRVPHQEDDQFTAARLGLRAMAVAPLRAPEGEIAGTLAISWRTAREVSDQEIDLLQLLADQAAIALAAARLDSLLRESEARYRHLVENSPDLVWAIDEHARFTFISDTCERLTGWKPEQLIGSHFGSIVHPSSADVASRDWAAEMVEGSHELRGRVNLLHRDGHPIPAEFLARTLVVDGTFSGANGSVRDMTERDRLEVELRRQAAALAAGDERAHLARELHDSVTQALFSMTLITRSIEVLLGRDPEAAAAKIATLRDLQRDALAEMRALIFELRPGSLEQDGLVHALRTHTAAVQGRLGLPIVFESDLPERLPIEVEDAFYRIGQEALHNVVKHAEARQVRVELRALGDAVRLVVTDDGAGFDQASVPAGHLGLASMRTRAEKIGAALELHSARGKGTTVAVVAPARPRREISEDAALPA